MADTKKHYAQIGKEALALIWACESPVGTVYILRKHIVLETDHKPLVPIPSNNFPPQVLKFHLRLLRFDYCM